MRLAFCRLDLVSLPYAVNAFKSKTCSMMFGTVRVQNYGHICGAREFASAVLQWFCFVLECRDTSHCCFPSVSYCPPANVCLLSDVSQESATPAFRRLYHAGKETELVMQFQIPEPTLWVAKGSSDRFQFELSTGTSTTFAERHLSCRPMAVRVLSFLPCKTLTDQPSGY